MFTGQMQRSSQINEINSMEFHNEFLVHFT